MHNHLIYYYLSITKQPLEVVADLSLIEDADKLLDAVIAHYGQLDVLVNNAGIYNIKEVEPLDDFDRVLQVNLRSVYQLCIRSLPYLEKTKGCIINNSSICGLKPV